VTHSYELEKSEFGSCVSVLDWNGSSMVLVGTAFGSEVDEEEPSSGRILLFSIQDNHSLYLVGEIEVDGCVYSIAAMSEGLVAAGINSKVSFWMQ
jgi:hypothetical protein